MRHKPEPVSGKYGAPMGRFTGPDYLCAEAGPVTLQRVRLNSGGYDSGGAYWGLGQPLYWACDDDGNSRYFRAADRSAAKTKLREMFGDDLKFYR